MNRFSSLVGTIDSSSSEKVTKQKELYIVSNMNVGIEYQVIVVFNLFVVAIFPTL